MPSTGVLKSIVIGLGVVLVLGLGLLVYGVALRVGEATRPAPWSLTKLGEPAGTRVGAISQSGSTIIVHLYTGNPGTDERLVLIDATSGRVVGRIAVTEPR